MLYITQRTVIVLKNGFRNKKAANMAASYLLNTQSMLS